MLLLLANVAWSQRTVRGKVTDAETGEALIGATVSVVGTTRGASTDVEGNYSVEVPAGGLQLRFAYTGYAETVFTLGTSNEVNIALQAGSVLDEVVVIGYGTVKKSDATGAVGSITSKDFNRGPVATPEQLMQGRIPGVQITNNGGEPGGGASVRIRGASSIRSGNEPLYVVDGVPINSFESRPDGARGIAGYDGALAKNPLAFLNPNDIERIDVLKDASAAAIYGTRASNGVVMITTKKGKEGRSELTYNTYFGMAQLRKPIDVMSAEEWRAARRSKGFTDDDPAKGKQNSGDQDYGYSTDWQDEIFRTAPLMSHALSYGGGSGKTNYRMSLGYQDEQGIINRSGATRYSGRVSLNSMALNDRLTIATNLGVTSVRDQRAFVSETGGYEGDLIQTALKQNPTLPVRITDPNDPLYSETTEFFTISNSVEDKNPVSLVEAIDDNQYTTRVLGNISTDLNLFAGIHYKFNFGIDYANSNRKFQATTAIKALQGRGVATIGNNRDWNRLYEHYLTWDRDFGNNTIGAMVGYSYQRFDGDRVAAFRNGFSAEGINYYDAFNFGDPDGGDNPVATSFAYRDELQSVFGRVNYDYADKYLVTVSVRRDGSTKFYDNNKYATFPAVALAWRLDQESFIQDMGVFDNLKLRLGWGLTGNQELPRNQAVQSYGQVGGTSIDGNQNYINGLSQSTIANPDLTWETTTQYNAGIDFGFWDGRLNGSFDYFLKNTEDLLFNNFAPAPTPVSNFWTNLDGKLQSSGIELGLNAVLVNKAKFSYSTNINFTAVTSKMTDFQVTRIYTGVASGQGLTGVQTQIIGNDLELGTWFGPNWQGFDDQGFDVFKKDANGATVREILGQALPDFTWGWGHNFTFGDFDLSFFFNGQQGNLIYNNTANELLMAGPLKNARNTTLEAIESGENLSNALSFSNRWLEDGSFIRLNNATLGYNFNLPRNNYVNGLRMYVTGTNLLLITDYTGYDPEINTNAQAGGIPSIGIDKTNYPRPRTFLVGVDVRF